MRLAQSETEEAHSFPVVVSMPMCCLGKRCVSWDVVKAGRKGRKGKEVVIVKQGRGKSEGEKGSSLGQQAERGAAVAGWQALWADLTKKGRRQKRRKRSAGGSRTNRQVFWQGGKAAFQAKATGVGAVTLRRALSKQREGGELQAESRWSAGRRAGSTEGHSVE